MSGSGLPEQQFQYESVFDASALKEKNDFCADCLKPLRLVVGEVNGKWAFLHSGEMVLLNDNPHFLQGACTMGYFWLPMYLNFCVMAAMLLKKQHVHHSFRYEDVVRIAV